MARSSGMQLIAVFGSAFLIAGFQNCSGVGFSGIEAAKKASALDDGGVLDDGSDDDGSSVSIDTDRICSTSRTGSNGGVNLVGSSTLNLEILDQTQKVVCSFSNAQNLKNQILNSSRIQVPSCALTEDALYTIKLTGDQGKSLLLSNKTGPFKSGKPFAIEVLADANLMRGSGMGKEEADEAQPYCDKRQSPLVLDTRRNVKEKGVRLSSPEEGVLFDIAGLNARPAPHTKYRISWPKSKRYEFLVLPNAQGRVEGINEMFGDNTLGPDRKFAGNGFLALAKYDENADGVISEDDAIFHKLRLWADLNRDGQSQAHEMRSLKRAEIEAIDLVMFP